MRKRYTIVGKHEHIVPVVLYLCFDIDACFLTLQVNIMDILFQEGKALPPLFKNQPPVAGSVFWERSLFLRMKNPIIKFLTMQDMMLTERGKAVSPLVLLLSIIMAFVWHCC